ncbi:hypothetical protein YC2023_017638 [Brassica napus]
MIILVSRLLSKRPYPIIAFNHLFIHLSSHNFFFHLRKPCFLKLKALHHTLSS